MLLAHPWIVSHWLRPVWKDVALWEACGSLGNLPTDLPDNLTGNLAGHLAGHFFGDLSEDLSRELAQRALKAQSREGYFTLHHSAVSAGRVSGIKGINPSKQANLVQVAGSRERAGSLHQKSVNSAGAANSTGQGELKNSASPWGALYSASVPALKYLAQEKNGGARCKKFERRSDEGQAGYGEMVVVPLSLSLSENPFELLAQVSSKAHFLCIIDWAMPERNLDYCCHSLPRALALCSGMRAYQSFKTFMRYGVEGVVERFNRVQCEKYDGVSGHSTQGMSAVLDKWSSFGSIVKSCGGGRENLTDERDAAGVKCHDNERTAGALGREDKLGGGGGSRGNVTVPLTSQPRVFLRQRWYKKYRGGSIIVVGYAVESRP